MVHTGVIAGPRIVPGEAMVTSSGIRRPRGKLNDSIVRRGAPLAIGPGMARSVAFVHPSPPHVIPHPGSRSRAHAP